MTQKVQIATEIGNIVLNINTPTDMYVGNAEGGQFLTLRNIRYNISLNLSLYDGKWSITRNSFGREEYHYLRLKKADCTDWKKDSASESARAKVLEIIYAKVNDWNRTIAASKIFAQLRLDIAREKQVKACGNIAMLKKDLEAAQDELRLLDIAVLDAERDLQSCSSISTK